MSAVYTIFTSPDHPPVPDHLPTLIVTPHGRPQQILYTYLHTNYNRENYLLTPSPQGDLCVAKLFPPPSSRQTNPSSSSSDGHGGSSSNHNRTVKCEASRNFKWSITNSGVLTPTYKCTLPSDDALGGPADEQPLFQVSKTNPQSPFWTCWYYAYAGHLIPPKRIQFGHISKSLGPDGKPITGGGTRVTITGKTEEEKAVWKTLGEGNEDMVEWAVICAALHVLDDEIVKAAEAAGIRIGVLPGSTKGINNRATPPPMPNNMSKPQLHPTGQQPGRAPPVTQIPPPQIPNSRGPPPPHPPPGMPLPTPPLSRPQQTPIPPPSQQQPPRQQPMPTPNHGQVRSPVPPQQQQPSSVPMPNGPLKSPDPRIRGPLPPNGAVAAPNGQQLVNGRGPMSPPPSQPSSSLPPHQMMSPPPRGMSSIASPALNGRPMPPQQGIPGSGPGPRPNVPPPPLPNGSSMRSPPPPMMPNPNARPPPHAQQNHHPSHYQQQQQQQQQHRQGPVGAGPGPGSFPPNGGPVPPRTAPPMNLSALRSRSPMPPPGSSPMPSSSSSAGPVPPSLQPNGGHPNGYAASPNGFDPSFRRPPANRPPSDPPTMSSQQQQQQPNRNGPPQQNGHHPHPAPFANQNGPQMPGSPRRDQFATATAPNHPSQLSARSPYKPSPSGAAPSSSPAPTTSRRAEELDEEDTVDSVAFMLGTTALNGATAEDEEDDEDDDERIRSPAKAGQGQGIGYTMPPSSRDSNGSSQPSARSRVMGKLLKR